MKSRIAHNTILNDLIESELGAVETYRQLVESCVGEATSARNEFRQLEIDHTRSVEALSRHLGLSEPPPLSPGKWKRFIVAMHDTFKTLDNPSMIAALKDGETKLVTQYEKALEDVSISDGVLNLIESTLLPKARAHSQSINRFIVAQTGMDSRGVA